MTVFPICSTSEKSALNVGTGQQCLMFRSNHTIGYFGDNNLTGANQTKLYN